MISLLGGVSLALMLWLFWLVTVWSNARHPPRSQLAEEIAAML
jgi:hypothetical protein